MKFIVKDWAGNTIDFYGVFERFEDAWGAIYENFDHLGEKEFDEQMGEFYVELKGKTND